MQENDEKLAELLLIPKIGRAKASALYAAGYRNLDDIAAADPLDLSKTPGINLSLAKEMVTFVNVMGSAKESGDGLMLTCPMCGTLIAEGTKTCPGCGIAFTEEWEQKGGRKGHVEHDVLDAGTGDVDGAVKSPAQEKTVGPADGYWYKEDASLFICPECGSLVSDGAAKCPNCGVLFDDEDDEDVPATEIDGAKRGDDGFWYKEQEQLFMCPNCGSFIASDAKSCSACGIVFEEEDDDLDAAEPENMVCPMCQAKLPENAETCDNCGFDFTAEKEHDDFWMKEQDGLFMCPNCGVFLPSSASQCSSCGVVFEDDDDEIATPEPDILFCPMCGQELDKGAVECSNCGFDFTAEKEHDDFWMKEQKGLSMCPNCGSLTAADADSCPNCGVLFDGEEDVGNQENGPSESDRDTDKDGHWYREQKGLSMCPNCGSFIAPDAQVCNACGIAFDDEEEELEPAPDFVTCPMCQNMLPATADSCDECGFDFTAERKHDGFWYKKSGSLFICPNCGAFLSESADTCHNCGTAFIDEEMVEENVDKLIDSVELEQELDSVIHSGEEADVLEELADVPEPDVDMESVYLCPVCGAFIEANLTKCPSCNSVFDDIEELDLEPVNIQANIVNPEELSREMSAEIEEIEAELLDEPMEPEEPDDTKRGVSRDFLDRWEKLDSKNGADEEKPSLVSDFKRRWKSSQITDREIEEELGLEDLIVEVDIDDLSSVGIDELDGEEAWSQRARECAAGGDIDEAVACLERAAELNPAREMEYKRRMLELMGVGPAEEGIDLSDITEIDELGELAVDEKMIAESRLEELEAKLEHDPDNGNLWQEKGEILEQLERHQEAIDCFDKSINLSYSSLKKEKKPDLRLPPIGIGMTNGQGRVNGRVNGLLIQRGLTNGRGRINGMTNGLVNGRGRTNGVAKGPGRTNGLTDGMTNGLINGGQIKGTMKGHINGLTNGLTNGLVNGMANGLVNGAGLINGGLVNGLGLVNGGGLVNGAGTFRKLRHRQRDRMMWRYRLSAMVMFIVIILMLSMLNNLMVREESGTIYIDGNFADWNNVPAYYDSAIDQMQNPDLNILEAKILAQRDRMSLYINVEGTILQGAGIGSNGGNNSNEFVDSLVAFVDLDDDAATGYAVGGIGADMAVDVYGWDNYARRASTLVFDNEYEQDDWNGFGVSGTSPVAVGGSEMEVRLYPPRTIGMTPEHPRVIMMLESSQGYSDTTDFLLSELPAALDIVSYSTGADSLAINSRAVSLAHITARGRLSSPIITGFNFRITGSANLDDVSNIRIINDTSGNGGQDSDDLPLPGTVTRNSKTEFSFILQSPMTVPLNRTMNFWLNLDLEANATGKTIGAEIVNATTDGSLAYCRNMNTMLHHVGAASGMEIDGAFGDWSSIPGNVDASDDIVFQGMNISRVNRNVDLANIRALADENLYVFLSVGGTMLGGEEMPAYRTRPVENPEPINETYDSDRDTVPDRFDPMPFDFDNDGVNNTDENGDWDSDGTAEGKTPGTDYWLNTTIPTDFPANWANRFVSIYVGPIGHVEALGYDSAYVMIDADNDVRTGTNVFGAAGTDFVALITGKTNHIISSQLFEFNLSQGPEPWSYVNDIDSAIDWYRMELAIDPVDLGIGTGSNFTIQASMEDWNHDYDVSDETIELTALNVQAGTRAPKPRMSIIKSGPATAGPGDTITYTISITNLGKNPAYNTVITEYYPADVTFVSASPAPDSGNNVWDIGTVLPGETVTISITVTVDSTVVNGDVLTNTAEVYYDDGAWWSQTRRDSVDTTIIIVPEMQNLILPIGGIFLMVIIFNNRRPTYKQKKRGD